MDLNELSNYVLDLDEFDETHIGTFNTRRLVHTVPTMEPDRVSRSATKCEVFIWITVVIILITIN